MRHSGFGIVASVTESYLNSLIEAGFTAAGPYYFPLPTTVMVGGTAVRFSGVALIAPPRVELHGGFIRAHFAFYGRFKAQFGNQPMWTYRVRLDVVADLGLTVTPVNNQLVLNLLTSAVSFAPLKVTVLEGGTPPKVVMDALQSPVLADAASTAVKLLPTIPLWTLAPAVYTHTEPYSYAGTNTSVFDWFTVRLVVSGVQLRVFEGAVTVAADFGGVTKGDPNGLVDLTTSSSRWIYRWVLTDKGIEQQSPPFVVRDQRLGSPGLAVLVNLALMADVVRQISDQTIGTTIRERVELIGLGLRYATFDKPLRGPEDGLALDVKVRVFDDPAVNLLTFLKNTGTAHVYLQPFALSYDGWRYQYQGPERWRLYVARLDLETTWLVEVLTAVFTAVYLTAFMLVSPLVFLNQELFDATVGQVREAIGNALSRAIPANSAGQVQDNLQRTLFDPGLPQGASYITVGDEGIETGWFGPRLTPSYTPQLPEGGARIEPGTWPTTDRRPIVTSVKLDPSWQSLVRSSLQAEWEVRRADTNEVVVTGVKPYGTGVGNGVRINHHSEALYLVDAFVVRCRLIIASAGQAGEIWSGTTTIRVTDNIDRRQSFVEWGPQWVRFRNVGTNYQMWSRLSRSRIHRTAVAARCRGLKIAAELRADDIQMPPSLRNRRLQPFRYFDYLPYGWENAVYHRRELCDYCFFGGPDKAALLPIPDWFEPNAQIKFEQKVTPFGTGLKAEKRYE